MANLETPEQVRQKMAERLNELKQKREEERVDEVNRRLEQRFKDSKDSIISSICSNRRSPQRSREILCTLMPNGT